MTFFSGGGGGGGSDDVIVSDRLASENFSNPGLFTITDQMTKFPAQTRFQISCYMYLSFILIFHMDIIQKLEITDKKNKQEPFTFL